MLSRVDRLRSALRQYQVTFGPWRGILMLVRRLLFGRSGKAAGQLVRARGAGFAHPVWVRWGATDDLTYFQVFGKDDYDFDYDGEITSIIDAGANIGLASLYFAHRFPGATIVAVEPDPDNVRVLRRNCEPYPQIRIVEAALWSESGEVSLIDPGLGEWGYHVGSPAPTPATAAEVTVRAGKVRAITVADAIEMLGTDRVDLLKVDIEGGEREVFAASDGWIDRIDSIVIELHEEMSPGAKASFESATAAFPRHVRRGENRYRSRHGAPTG